MIGGKDEFVVANSGVFQVPLICILDRELLLQSGRDLRTWANENGVPYSTVVSALSGADVTGRESLLTAIASTLGVSLSALYELCEMNPRPSFAPAPA